MFSVLTRRLCKLGVVTTLGASLVYMMDTWMEKPFYDIKMEQKWGSLSHNSLGPMIVAVCYDYTFIFITLLLKFKTFNTHNQRISDWCRENKGLDPSQEQKEHEMWSVCISLWESNNPVESGEDTISIEVLVSVSRQLESNVFGPFLLHLEHIWHQNHFTVFIYNYLSLLSLWL